MKFVKWTLFAVMLVLLSLPLVISCGDDDDDDDDDSTAYGSLEFVANGEDFIRDGFVGKTGWDISFDHFYVNISGPTAFQVVEEELTAGNDPEGIMPAHAGHSHTDIPEGSAHVALTGEYWIDLHEGTAPLPVGTAEDAPVGNYNYMNFDLVQTDTGDYSGYSIVMIGTATKDSETVPFLIKLTEELAFSGCHQEVDDEYAGVVAEGETGSFEMTFHSDHLFGDYDDLGNPDGVNPIALGFQAFADLATDGSLDIDQAGMEANLSADDYATFMAALYTLGHSGEGHCDCDEYGAEEEE